MGGVDHDEQKKSYESSHGNGHQESSQAYREQLIQSYMKKKREELTEREWRIFREDHDIMIKGGRIPNPIRFWDEIEDMNESLKDNISSSGYKRPMPI